MKILLSALTLGHLSVRVPSLLPLCLLVLSLLPLCFISIFQWSFHQKRKTTNMVNMMDGRKKYPFWAVLTKYVCNDVNTASIKVYKSCNPLHLLFAKCVSAFNTQHYLWILSEDWCFNTGELGANFFFLLYSNMKRKAGLCMKKFWILVSGFWARRHGFIASNWTFITFITTVNLVAVVNVLMMTLWLCHRAVWVTGFSSGDGLWKQGLAHRTHTSGGPAEAQAPMQTPDSYT